MRKAKSIEELLPWLYLKGISTGDFHEALAALLGPNAAGLSSTTISRLAYYLDQKDRIDHITGIIAASRDLETRNKDIGIMTSKAVGTYSVDAAVFGGLPVTTGLASIYDVGARFFRRKK